MIFVVCWMRYNFQYSWVEQQCGTLPEYAQLNTDYNETAIPSAFYTIALYKLRAIMQSWFARMSTINRILCRTLPTTHSTTHANMYFITYMQQIEQTEYKTQIAKNWEGEKKHRKSEEAKWRRAHQ